jgi:DNA-binding transcriptional regulator of glucitol operon
MPIWLRNFTVKQITNFRQRENSQIEKSTQKNSSTSAQMGENVPEHIKQVFQQNRSKPTYTTKKSKK